MKAREEILRRVRSALVADRQGRSSDAGGDQGKKDQGTSRGYAHTRDLPDRLALFVERVEDYQASVIRTRPDDVVIADANGRYTTQAGVVAARAGHTDAPPLG